MATPTDISFERGLPASIESERLILGAILLDNHAYNEAAEKLRAEDFALDSHQRVFARMADLIDAGRAVDIVTLTEELARRKEVEAVGGVAYLASLIEGLPHRLSIEDYVTLSPVYSTQTKPGYGPALAPARASALAGEVPWLALGGIDTPVRAAACAAAGARGVAVMGAVMRATDPERVSRELAAAFGEARTARAHGMSVNFVEATSDVESDGVGAR